MTGIKLTFLLSIFLLLPALSGNLHGQARILRLIDATTSTPIPYVNIYLPGNASGTITDGEGFAKVLLDTLDLRDSIVFSSLNYLEQRVTVGDILSDLDTIDVQLTGVAYDINTVKIVADRIEYKQKKLGDKRRPNNARYDLTTVDPPGEIGKIVDTQHRSFIDSITIYVEEMEVDSFLLEVNIYDFSLQWPGRKLQSERIIQNVERGAAGQTIGIDLTEQNIAITDKVLVTLRGLRYNPDGPDTGLLLIGARVGSGKGLERRVDGSWSDTYTTPALTVHVRQPK